MATGSTLFEDYGAYHRDPRNLVCHEIGIPLIVFGILALLRLVAVPSVPALNLAGIAMIAVDVYYLTLGRSVRSAAIAAVVGLMALYLLASLLTWPMAVAAFIAGWIFQFVGHKYEGKAPAFLTNVLHLLVGPLWVASHLVPASASSSSAR